MPKISMKAIVYTPPVGKIEVRLEAKGYTVHKVNDRLHPIECIPETQFLMRSKIHPGVLPQL
jgi:hypothetical protein